MHGWKIIFSKTERTTMRALASSLALCLASTAAFADKVEEESARAPSTGRIRPSMEEHNRD
jgi:hypothetical protein